MKAAGPPGWGPMVAAFVIWFVHFMLCWAAAEFWPGQWRANLLAWAATPLALLALGVHWRRLDRGAAGGDLAGWTRRLGRGATAIACVAVVFSAWPSLVFLP